ncbi:MAG TPA: M55 family metallopeptidase [Mycobacteriales bacterium]|nr:M55 family metallopeptidase [Mycobacteriales bacterium]
MGVTLPTLLAGPAGVSHPFHPTGEPGSVRAVKVYLSSDMEGTAGIVDWAQCVGPGAAYEHGRRLLLAEVNAAIDGALAAGAETVLVNDSHSSMQNLPPDELHGRAEYLSGRHKPFYMMQGLDSSFAAVLFVSYHASVGTAGVLSHTYNPAAIAGVRLNGTVAGESGINALVAAGHRVPIALITGDQYVGPEAEPFCPGIEAVPVKHAVGRTAARNLHPDTACERIRAGAERAVRRVSAGQFGPPRIDLPARLEVDFRTGELADMATWLTGPSGPSGSVTRTGTCTATFTDDDPLRLYQRFVAAIHLTRAVAEVR